MDFPIRMYATSWCPDCRDAREFLRDREICFEETDIDADPGAADFVVRANSGKRKVPTFNVGGRIFHCSPFDAAKMIKELGLQEADS